LRSDAGAMFPNVRCSGLHARPERLAPAAKPSTNPKRTQFPRMGSAFVRQSGTKSASSFHGQNACGLQYFRRNVYCRRQYVLTRPAKSAEIGWDRLSHRPTFLAAFACLCQGRHSGSSPAYSIEFLLGEVLRHDFARQTKLSQSAPQWGQVWKKRGQASHSRSKWLMASGASFSNLDVPRSSESREWRSGLVLFMQ
jgi:hypothetical protein